MPRFKERGAVQFLIPLILLAGIIAGIYLVQKTQIFKPQAAAQAVEWVISSGQDPDNCVTTQDSKTVATCPKVKFKVTAPEDIKNTSSTFDYTNEDE